MNFEKLYYGEDANLVKCETYEHAVINQYSKYKPNIQNEMKLIANKKQDIS